MLSIKLKPFEELLSKLGNNVVVICCEGCSELSYPEGEVIAMLNELTVSRAVLKVINLYYVCNEEHLNINLQNNANIINNSDTVLAISCGVGIQILSEQIRNEFECKNISIIAGCDTYPLPGFQGLTPSLYDCALCGECKLNETGAICPVTACSKSLVNGQCGGARDGKCEVDSNLECGWERIYKRLEQYNAAN